MRAFRVKGTTQDVTSCELCGRCELRGTVVLEVMDADGNGTGEVVYYGRDCGRQAAGWTLTEMNRRIRTAEDETRAAERAAREAKWQAQQEEFNSWVSVRYGVTIRQTSDLKIPGKTPFQIRKEFLAETA